MIKNIDLKLNHKFFHKNKKKNYTLTKIDGDNYTFSRFTKDVIVKKKLAELMFLECT